MNATPPNLALHRLQSQIDAAKSELQDVERRLAPLQMQGARLVRRIAELQAELMDVFPRDDRGSQAQKAAG